MKQYTLSVTPDELVTLQKIFQYHLIEDQTPYLFFHAKHNNIDVLAYQSGKVLLQGDEVSQALTTIKQHLNRVDYEAIGSDEVGTGDVFGPMVICSLYVGKDDFEFLENLNVRDSKNMKDDMIIKIAPKIAQKLNHTLLILNPKKYNSLNEQGINMNKMKALLHNQAIIKTTSKVPENVPVILDQFCTPQLYFNYLKDETLIYRDIDFRVRAEQVHVAVAAASIVARYAFLVKMSEYSTKLGIKLPKGAGKDVDQMIEQIYQNRGLKTLELIAKMNFKNITRVIHP
jgi:ribonuclease HIII